MGKLKLKAATLVESLVAMVVVMLCFGIASMIYVNVMNSENKRSLLSAHLLLKGAAIKTKQEKSFLDEEVRIEQITIRKSIGPYKELPDISLLTLTATDDNGKVIEVRKELICTGCTGN